VTEKEWELVILEKVREPVPIEGRLAGYDKIVAERL